MTAQSAFSEMFRDAHPVGSTVVLVGLALLPMVLLAVSSFLKISVVLTIVRNAIGAQQVPSSALISLLAIVLSLQVMQPVISEMWQRAEGVADKNMQVADYLSVGQSVVVPLETFLKRHSATRERLYFAQFGRPQPTVPTACATTTSCDVPDETLVSLLPSFLLTELKEAFAMGFALFLPFLVIDLIVANILLALGMSMMNPVTVSLPFKLLLFVLSDGWFLLSRGLLEGYA